MVLSRNFVVHKIIKKLPLSLKKYELKPSYKSFNSQNFINKTNKPQNLDARDLKKINYACGKKYLENWLNVDFYYKNSFLIPDKIIYYPVDLTAKHPFPDNYFEFGFAEDFIEHLQQVDSIIFLNECYRTFKTGGVLRLSFPGLEGVFQKHYQTMDYETVIKAKEEAFTAYGHFHFYSRDELRTVAKHIGYREVNFVDYGASSFPELNNLDTRKEQIGLNTYVELIK
ncbi:methyltransferase domain-containing protein [Myxosarcina sp. GI1]|uniref:class I SAM-dependent methyltransferase n=1 Tax=Myxosarcina sp. GI1 TaxID=1541065 RepID=UPI000568B5F8|nr:methyltransferase domain-containing protein [Myxosarcina sp. GI1]